MNVRTLTILTAVLGIAELLTAVFTVVEHTPNSAPVMQAVFAVPWFVSWLLLRSGRVTAGAIVSGLLCLFILLAFPTWRHYSTFDRVWQIAYAVTTLAGLVTSVGVLARRRSATARVS